MTVEHIPWRFQLIIREAGKLGRETARTLAPWMINWKRQGMSDTQIDAKIGSMLAEAREKLQAARDAKKDSFVVRLLVRRAFAAEVMQAAWEGFKEDRDLYMAVLTEIRAAAVEIATERIVDRAAAGLQKAGTP